MNKVICDICGTTYPETAEQCPICGFARDMGAASADEMPVEEIPQAMPARQQVKGGRFSAANVRKRNNSTPRYQAQLVDDEDEEYIPTPTPRAPVVPQTPVAPRTPVAPQAPGAPRTPVAPQAPVAPRTPVAPQAPAAPRNPVPAKPPKAPKAQKAPADDSNKPLVIILIILIAAVLVVSAFLFTKYALPAITGDDKETTKQTEEESTESEPTEEPTVPCETLTLLDGTGKDLTEEGQYWLLNVDVQPADTTDKLEFSSDNPDVATVNEEGRIQAVGEGEAVITVKCGAQEVTFNVTCVFATEPPETEPTEPEPTEPPTTEPTEPEPVKMTVNVKKLSIRSGAGTDNEKVGSYKKGEEVTIYEQITVNNEKWGRTDKGWICIDYCT